jgi:MFS family permease
VKRLIAFLAVGYALYALVIGWVVTSLLLRVRDEQALTGETITGVQLVPLITLSVITAVFIILFASLAVLLARRRARRASLVIAGISCVGIPLGTILGGLTIYALTRPDVISEFTPTA